MAVPCMKKQFPFVFIAQAVLLVLLTATATAQEGIPDWVESPDSSVDRLAIVGGGGGKQEALFDAIVQFAQAVETYLFSIDFNTTSVSRLSIGKVCVKSTEVHLLGKKNTPEEGEAPTGDGETPPDETATDKETVESTASLVYTDGEKMVRMSRSSNRIVTFGVEEKTVDYNFQVITRNCTLADLIETLKREGCSFRFHGDSEQYYVSIEMEMSRIAKHKAASGRKK